jgi:membrane-associated protease RseP (regulator of RpoE activity)
MTHLDDHPGDAADGPVSAPPPPPGGYVAPRAPRDEPKADQTRQFVSLALLVVGLIWLTSRFGPWGLVVIGALVLMIFLHELGHFLMAKRAGMKVTEFFIGFGPRLWSFRRGETEYGIKAIPAGAYVKIVGMNNLDEVDPADEARAYRQKPFRDRLGVAVAGSAMHFIQALVVLFILLAIVGMPGGSVFRSPSSGVGWKVADVTAESPAASAGIAAGDRITSVAGHSTTNFGDLQSVLAHRAHQRVEVVYLHRGATKRATVQLGLMPETADNGRLGIGVQPVSERLGVASAVTQSVKEFGTVSHQSVQGLFHLFSPSGLSGFYRQLVDSGQKDTGPTVDASKGKAGATSGSGSGSSSAADRPLSIVGVFRITTSAGQGGGIMPVLVFFVLINVFIGLFNLTPLLPFDGGHVVIAAYEKFQETRRRERRRYFADVSRLLPLTYAVFLVLIGLFASTLYLDIVRPPGVN